MKGCTYSDSISLLVEKRRVLFVPCGRKYGCCVSGWRQLGVDSQSAVQLEEKVRRQVRER